MLRILVFLVVGAAALVVWLASSWWSDVPPRGEGSLIPSSDVLLEASTEALCRPPRDADTARWDVRPYDRVELVAALKNTLEGKRASAIRDIYLKVLGRNPLDGDCTSVRNWVDGGLALDQIERQVANSAEARQVAEVRRVFADVFHRDPIGWDNASLRYWVESGLSPDEIEARLAVQRPLVGVYYFTWYGRSERGWGNGATDVHTDASRPSLGWYDSTDRIVIDTHIDQMTTADFDFVVVNVIAESPASWANARHFFERLEGRPLKAALMLDGLHTDTAVKTHWVEKVQAEFTRHPNYFWYHDRPLILLFAARMNFVSPGAMLRNVYWTNSYGPGTNTFNLDYILSPRDWPFWSTSPQPLVNGAVPVVPGYVDTHLGRSNPMEHPRNGGAMYHAQWQHALSLRPEIILVYSWNEHLEQTAIEPTDAWGDRYLKWTACYIARAHAGVADPCL